MVQLHLEDDYVVVVEVEVVDLVITTTKAQARVQDLITPKDPPVEHTQYSMNSKQELDQERL
jgi:hypothetical protein